MIQEQTGHDTAALSYYRQSIAQAIAQGDLGSQTDTYLSLAKYYQAAHTSDSAIAYAQQALQLSLTTAYATGKLDAATILATAYDGANPIQSYRYYKMADSAKEELYNTEKLRQLQNMQYEERERQQELANLKEEATAERSENLQLLGIAGFIPGFFLLLLVLSRVHIRQRLIDILGVASALLVFEFVTLLLHPRIAAFTHKKPIPELLILMLMAALFAPLHHKFHHWVKALLAKAGRRKPVAVASQPKSKPAVRV